MPKSRKIDAVWANNAVAYLNELGHDAELILKEAHLSLAEVSEADGRISFLRFSEFFEAAARVTQDRSFGLNVGLKGSPKEAGLLGYIILHSPTLYEAIFNATRFLRVHNEGTRGELNIIGETATLELMQLEHRVEDIRQMSEFQLSLTATIFGYLVGQKIPLIAVEFEHHPVGDPSAYERIFGVKPKFNASRNALAMPTRFLYETALPDADSKLLNILTEHAKEILKKMPDAEDLVAQIVRLVIDRLSDGVPSANSIAKELAMSSRTMARRLAEIGKSYRDIVDDSHRRLAIEYVQNVSLRLSEIAFLLGYSELSAFNHAFKRWTGRSPSAYR